MIPGLFQVDIFASSGCSWFPKVKNENQRPEFPLAHQMKLSLPRNALVSDTQQDLDRDHISPARVPGEHFHVLSRWRTMALEKRPLEEHTFWLFQSAPSNFFLEMETLPLPSNLEAESDHLSSDAFTTPLAAFSKLLITRTHNRNDEPALHRLILLIQNLKPSTILHRNDATYLPQMQITYSSILTILQPLKLLECRFNYLPYKSIILSLGPAAASQLITACSPQS